MKKSYLMLVFISIIAILMSNYSCKKDKNGDLDDQKEQEDTTNQNPEDSIPDTTDVTKINEMKIYAHYMPWFETPESADNGSWGIHWTMATKNPFNIDNTGKREIATYYYPLIGPYASSDEDVLEYHLLLMKYSGIDGVLIDWYGTIDLFDYPDNFENSEALIEMVNKTGLSFGICYEDRTVQIAFDNSTITDKIEAAQADMEYLENNLFSMNSYITIENKPVLMIFGPETFHTEDDWTQIFSDLSLAPCFITLWYKSGDAGDNATGEYAWVYENNTHLDNFYNNQQPKFDVVFGGAYPGFKDFYEEGGWGSSFGWEIDMNDGETFETTLNKAKDAEIEYLQLITWNDFGEGTMIEPTLEFEYTMLTILQEFTGVTYSITELEYIKLQYDYRKEYKDDSAIQDLLDQSFAYFVSLQPEKAIEILDGI